MNTETIALTPALSRLMGEPGQCRPGGLMVFFDTEDEAKQWVLARLHWEARNINILACSLDGDTTDAQIDMIQAALDPEGDFLGRADAAAWRRDMCHAIRGVWRDCSYSTADGRIGVTSDGVWLAYRSMFI
mgnify:CR=1 FL=1